MSCSLESKDKLNHTIIILIILILVIPSIVIIKLMAMHLKQPSTNDINGEFIGGGYRPLLKIQKVIASLS